MMLLALLPSAGALQPILTQTRLAGNVKFDPLNLATVDLHFKTDRSVARGPDDILWDYREAELKHARLAMLASVAYPAQELIQPLASQALNLPNGLSGGLSPSLVNGGLDVATLVLFAGLASGLELYKLTLKRPIDEASTPGDYGWRFLVSKDEEMIRLQEGEIWNGRLAMMAVLGYVVQEAVTGQAVLGVFA